MFAAGYTKPPTFKLGRSNLFGDAGTVFEYMLSPEAPGTWCRWQDQVRELCFLYDFPQLFSENK